MNNFIFEKEDIKDWMWKTIISVKLLKKINAISPKKLILVLGLGRSGTTWVSRTLSKTKTPIRYLEEPFSHIRPRLSYSSKIDHTAIDYKKTLSDNNRLLLAYKLLNLKKSKKLYNIGLRKFIKRDDKYFKYCLIKEVHSLLATEALIKKLGVPTIIVLRDPLYVTDSLFATQTLNTKYLKNENFFIANNKNFLKKYFNNHEEIIREYNKITNFRNKTILNTFLTISIITKYLEALSKSNKDIYLVRYEKICLNSDTVFKNISNFINIKYNINQQSRKIDNNPYSINRDSKKQLKKTFVFLSNKEVENLKTIQKKLNLTYLYQARC